MDISYDECIVCGGDIYGGGAALCGKCSTKVSRLNSELKLLVNELKALVKTTKEPGKAISDARLWLESAIDSIHRPLAPLTPQDDMEE